MEPNTPRAEAERWLGISAKMLASRDLVGSRSFAIRGREADPTNPISEQIIAIVDTLIAAEKRVTNSGHHDWYSILQVSHLARDLDLIASQYRRLFLLLNPDHNHFPFADYALRAVADAWSVLSDPSKKWMYDSELSNFLQRSSVPPEPEPVRVDSSATYQFFHQPTQQQQWIHHLQSSEQPQVQPQLQERQLFQQQQQHHQAPPQSQPQHQWLPQTQLQQLLPEHQRPSQQPQWLPQSPQSHSHQPPQQQSQQQPWMPEQQQQQQQRPPPPSKEPQLHRPAPHSNENQVPPQLQRPQPQIPHPQQKPKQTLPSPSPPPAQPPPPPPPVQIPPFQQHPQAPPRQLPQQPPPQQPPQQPPPQEPVRENGNNENDCNETGSMVDDDANGDDDGEQTDSFWTACPYCYYLYEYPNKFEDCTLRCQNCRRAFQAIPVPGPPANGGAASFCSWGFFPIGFSMTSWKRKNASNANGFGSNWMPFSPMFACPLQQKQPRTKVWEIVDEDEDEINDSDSSDDPDSSDDWGSTRRKGKKKSGRRGRPRKKSNVEKEKTSNNDVANGENPHRASQRLANHDSAAKQMGKGVRGRKKLDLNVEFSNEVEDHAPVRREGNNGEEVVEFFEGLDEFLSTLPILHVVGDEKSKAS